MIGRIILILLACWLAGFATSSGGTAIHVILLIVGMLILGKLLEPRPLR